MQIGRANRRIRRRSRDVPHALDQITRRKSVPKYPLPVDIIKLRERCQFSQSMAAELCLVSYRTYRRFEEGSVSMHPWVWLIYRKLAEAYLMSSDTLVMGEPVPVKLDPGEYLDWTEE